MIKSSYGFSEASSLFKHLTKNFNNIKITEEGKIKSKVNVNLKDSNKDKTIMISTNEINLSQNHMIIRELNKFKMELL